MESRNKNTKSYFIENLGNRFFFIFVIPFILCFPLPIYSINNPQELIAEALKPIIYWAGKYIWGLKGNFSSDLISDSTGIYIFGSLLFIPAMFISWIWTKYSKNNLLKLKYLINVVLSYYLSLVLFIYGANKLFKYQFYTPEPNTLFTPLGYLSKDILYWSTAGSSYSYNLIIGIAQLIPAIFLLFRHTRIIGAVICCILFVNIVIINFTYDISVKFFSSFLLILSFYIAYPAFKSLYLVFYKGIAFQYQEWIPQINSKKQLLFYTLFKTFIIGSILFESFYMYFRSGIFNGDTAPKSAMFGAYQILPLKSNQTIHRFFFHSKGYFIIQNENDEMHDYKILKTDMNKIVIEDYNLEKYELKYLHLKDTLILQGIIKTDTLNIKGVKINLETLPLLQKQFHFTIDSILN